jgi:exopolysaccharide production protein ExoZ
MPALCLLAGMVLFIAGGLVNELWYAGLIEQGYYVFPRVIVFGIPSLLWVAGAVAVEMQGHHANRRFSLLAGGASYAIYLSHVLILSLAWHLGLNTWLAGSGGIVGLLAYSLLVLLIFAISLLHYQVLEKRLHRLFKRGMKLAQAG